MAANQAFQLVATISDNAAFLMIASQHICWDCKNILNHDRKASDAKVVQSTPKLLQSDGSKMMLPYKIAQIRSINQCLRKYVNANTFSDASSI